MAQKTEGSWETCFLSHLLPSDPHKRRNGAGSALDEVSMRLGF